jgi:hypothetical protein
MSPIASEIENTLQNLPEDVRDDCIMAIKNKRNNQYPAINKAITLAAATTKTLVTTTKIWAVLDRQIEARAKARRRTNHRHQSSAPSRVGSATKKVTRKLIAGPD